MSETKKIICGKLYDGIDADFKERMEILVEGKTSPAAATPRSSTCRT